MMRIYLSLFIAVILFIFYRMGIYFSIPFYKVGKLYVDYSDVCGVISENELNNGKRAIEFAAKMDWDLFMKQITLSSCELCQTQNISFPNANTSFHMIVGRVIMIPQGRFPREFIIDVGSVHGVKKYSLVLKDGVLFGRVIDVSAYESRVLTIFSDDFFADIFFPSVGKRAMVHGSEDGALHVVVSYGNLSTFPEGETVVTAGSRYSAPFGIKVGVVRGETIRVLANSDNLLYITVITPSSE